MDFSIYVDLIIDQFKEAGGYSELDEDSLRQTLLDFFKQEYNIEMKEMALRIKLDKNQTHSIARYQLEHELIKRKILEKASELAEFGNNDYVNFEDLE